MEQINVEEIMKSIREEISRKGYDDSIPEFQEIHISDGRIYAFDYNDLKSNVDRLNQINYVSPRYELHGNSVSRFIKKVIRAIIQFTYKPIVANQNEFNASVTQSFNQVMGYVEEQRKVIDQYRDELETLEAKLKHLETQKENS